MAGSRARAAADRQSPRGRGPLRRDREAAERRGEVGGRDLQPAREEVGALGQHVGVHEQEVGAACVGGQRVARRGASGVGGQADQAGREGEGYDGGFHRFGQRGVPARVVQQHELHRAGPGGGLRLERGGQRARVVAEEGDEDGEAGRG